MKELITIIAAFILALGVIRFIPVVISILGNRAFAAGDMAKARAYFKKAAEMSKSASSKMTYAMMLMHIGEFAEAERLLNEVILYSGAKPIEKNNARAYRAMVRQKLGRLDEAIEDAEELFESFKNTMTYGVVGYLRQLKGGAELEFCREAYDYNSDDRDICDNYAVACIRSGDLKRAAELTAELREKYPKFVEGFYHSAVLALKTGDKAAAAEFLERTKECNRTAMTTVSEEEINSLKEEIKNA